MSQGIRMDMVRRLDSTENKNEYYFTCPDVPATLDLSKCVIFFYPVVDDGGKMSGELVIRTHRPRGDNRKDDGREDDRDDLG